MRFAMHKAWHILSSVVHDRGPRKISENYSNEGFGLQSWPLVQSCAADVQSDLRPYDVPTGTYKVHQ
jgi:hypothetical protein